MSKTPCVERLDIPLSECLATHHSKPLPSGGVVIRCKFGKEIYVKAGVKIPPDPCNNWR